VHSYRETQGKFDELINVGRKISKEIEELTGITNQELEKSTVFPTVFQRFKEFLIKEKDSYQAEEIHLVNIHITISYSS